MSALLVMGTAAHAAEAYEPGEVMRARLDTAATLDGAFDRPAKLARMCLDARLACGFELRADVWDRPVSRRRILSATVGQALAIFIGTDYRLDWRDGVLMVSPAVTRPVALDAGVSADIGSKSPADPARSLRDLARGIGLRLSVAGKPPLGADPGTGVTMPITAPARRVLELWSRPALAQPNSWITVYSRDGRSGRLYWFWGRGG